MLQKKNGAETDRYNIVQSQMTAVAALSIDTILDNLDRSKSKTVKEESYAQLIELFKLEDDAKVLKFLQENLWRFLKVFYRDLDDSQLYVKNILVTYVLKM